MNRSVSASQVKKPVISGHPVLPVIPLSCAEQRPERIVRERRRAVERNRRDRDAALPDRMHIGPFVRILEKRAVDPEHGVLAEAFTPV
jgi:hypothetical protein